jgi:hypothetical protein
MISPRNFSIIVNYKLIDDGEEVREQLNSLSNLVILQAVHSEIVEYTPTNYPEPKSSWQISHFTSWSEIDKAWKLLEGCFQLHIHSCYLCYKVDAETKLPDLICVDINYNWENGIYGENNTQDITSFKDINWLRAIEKSRDIVWPEQYMIRTTFGKFNIVSGLKVK